MRLQTKLLLGFLAIAAFVAVEGVIRVPFAKAILSTFNNVIEHAVPELILIEQANASTSRMLAEANSHLILTGFEGSSESSPLEATLGEELEEFDESWGSTQTNLAEFEGIADDDQEQEFARSLLIAAEEVHQAGLAAFEEINADSTPTEVNAVSLRIEDAEGNFSAIIEEALAYLQDDLEEESAYANQIASVASTVTFGGAALTIMIAIVLALYLSRILTKPLRALTSATEQMAGGDYAQRVSVATKDELGQLAQSFNSMAQTVQDREISLQELNTTLDRRVQQRTVDLEKATREAKEASRLKDEFLAIMSHELRTPLNAIIGFLGILGMSGKLDENSLHMTKRSRANAERLLNLINDILDISRIESGRLQLVPAKLSVDMMVERARSQTSVLAEQKGLMFDIFVDEDMPKTFIADEDAVLKVMVNLLGNACKFTEQGNVNLHLSRHGQQMMIKVADTGIGIPPHMHEIIFERFRQVDGSSKRTHGGSGLGLAIVRQYVLAMGGTITVNSEPGQGSTFTVLLPLEETTTAEGVSEHVAISA